MADTTHDPRPDEALGGGHTEAPKAPDPAAAADPDDPTDAGEPRAGETAGGEPADEVEEVEPDIQSPESDSTVPADAVEPADEVEEVEPVAATAPAFADDDIAAPDRGHEWVDRWTEIQVGFVDDPRRTIEAADALVGEVLDEVTATFANERARLESQWRSGEEPSTEDLRLALQRYRSFFDRLVAS